MTKNSTAKSMEKSCRFDPEKFVFKASEIPFFGYIISKVGIKPDTLQIESVVEMQIPEDVKQLSSFLELVNYLNKFLSRVSKL